MYVVATAELCRERNAALPLDTRYQLETFVEVFYAYSSIALLTDLTTTWTA
jgi:hypothetical protein